MLYTVEYWVSCLKPTYSWALIYFVQLLSEFICPFFPVKLSPTGSNPFRIINNLYSSQDVVSDRTDSSQNEKEKNVGNSNIKHFSDNSVKSDATVKSGDSVNSGDSVQEQSANSGEKTENSKNTKEDTKTKPKREEYEKHLITSKGDYKIRKKLDTADKLLQEVRAYRPVKERRF